MGGNANNYLSGGAGNDILNGRNGADTLLGGNGDDVLIAIDNGTSDYIQSGGGSDAIWVDLTGSSSDAMSGNSSVDRIQAVSSFANGADRTLNGDRIADPNGRIVDTNGNVSGSLTRAFSNNPLFPSTGPSANDVRQGACGDCYLLAELGAIAQDSPSTLRQNIVDFNDGTYGMRLGNSFYRVPVLLHLSRRSATCRVRTSMFASVIQFDMSRPDATTQTASVWP